MKNLVFTNVSGGLVELSLVMNLLLAGCASSTADLEWVWAFGYTSAEVHPIDVGDYGFPYVQVSIVDTSFMLPFDTGNMVGVSVSSDLFDRIGLAADGFYNQLNSEGEILDSFRLAHKVDVSILGHNLGQTIVYELDHPELLGLVGPTFLGERHFTLDYEAGKIGLGFTTLPDIVQGFKKVPLVRSKIHPTLILVCGSIEGLEVLLELDTGKSRTVINPTLVSDLQLKRSPGGVAINRLGIGELSFKVSSAKEVDQISIDPTLPEPILVGVGSDILSRFVWTVDYQAGVLWIPKP